METLDGRHHKFLLDTSWNHEYMDEAFKREGIDKMLSNREIEFLFISHEHLDHYWGPYFELAGNNLYILISKIEGLSV